VIAGAVAHESAGFDEALERISAADEGRHRADLGGQPPGAVSARQAAPAFRDDVARCSDMMSIGVQCPSSLISTTLSRASICRVRSCRLVALALPAGKYALIANGTVEGSEQRQGLHPLPTKTPRREPPLRSPRAVGCRLTPLATPAIASLTGVVFAPGRQLDKVITTSAAKPAPLGAAVAPVRALSAPKVVLSNNVKIVRPGSTEQNASGAMKKVPCDRFSRSVQEPS
jgi:hypothetical protein